MLLRKLSLWLSTDGHRFLRLLFGVKEAFYEEGEEDEASSTKTPGTFSLTYG